MKPRRFSTYIWFWWHRDRPPTDEMPLQMMLPDERSVHLKHMPMPLLTYCFLHSFTCSLIKVLTLRSDSFKRRYFDILIFPHLGILYFFIFLMFLSLDDIVIFIFWYCDISKPRDFLFLIVFDVPSFDDIDWHLDIWIFSKPRYFDIFKPRRFAILVFWWHRESWTGLPTTSASPGDAAWRSVGAHDGRLPRRDQRKVQLHGCPTPPLLGPGRQGGWMERHWHWLLSILRFTVVVVGCWVFYVVLFLPLCCCVDVLREKLFVE